MAPPSRPFRRGGGPATAAAPLLALALSLAACGDGEPTLFSAPAEIVAEGSLELQGIVGETPDPLPTLRVVDGRGNPVPGAAVAFRVEAGGGSVTPAELRTDEGGRVRPVWTLGERVGANVLVADLGPVGEVHLEAWASAGPPVSLAAVAPTRQEADAGSNVPHPPAVRFADRYDNPVPGVEVAFVVTEGGGSVDGSPATSDDEGIARVARWTLGRDEGPNRVVASSLSFSDLEFEALGTEVALTFTVESVHLNQASQRPEGDIGGISGRAGLLRVVARATSANDYVLDVLLRLYQGETLVREEVLSRSAVGVPTDPRLGNPADTWNLPLSGSEVLAGLRVEAILDPDSVSGVASRDGHRFPEGDGAASLDVQPLHPFRIVFIPVELTGEDRTGNVHPGNANHFLRDARRWIPSHEVIWEIHSPFATDADLTETSGWQQLLQELRAKRTAEGATDQYYHGIVPVFPGLAWGGYAYVGQSPGDDLRTGITYDGLPAAAGILAHELGHNLGRWHSPCGGASGVDASYPHSEAAIGPTGYDVLSGSLVDEGAHRDYMSYCGPRWTSDYTWEAILEWRRADPWGGGAPAEGAALGGGAASGSEAFFGGAGADGSGPGGEAGSRAAPRAPEPGILVWGRMGSDGVDLHPAFALEAPASEPGGTGPHQVRGVAEDGRELFRIAFEGGHPAHSPDPAERHFALFVPLDRADARALDRIELTSPLGRAVRRPAAPAPGPPEAPGVPDRRVVVERTDRDELRLRWDADRFPMALLRDPATGRVLGFARGGELQAPDRGRWLEGAEILLSDGVRSGPADRRR